MTRFDAHQYALDNGWDFTQIEDTARLGVADADAESLTEEESAALLAWCKEQVAEAEAKKAEADDED